jgi:hypothetical protein
VSEVAALLDTISGSAYVTVVSISLRLWLVRELPLLFELPIYKGMINKCSSNCMKF